MLAFIHFSMIQGIRPNQLLSIQDDQLSIILPAFKLEKQIIAKNLLKSLFWALSLGHSKYKTNVPLVFQLVTPLCVIDPLVLSSDNASKLDKIS